MKILTYNIEGEKSGTTETEVAANISGVDAEVVLLQELTNEQMLIDLLAILTNYDGYVYGTNGGNFNNGVLYKGTLLDSSVYDYTNLAVGDSRNATSAQIQSSGGSVYWVISTHLGLGDDGANGQKRTLQVGELKSVTDGLTGTVILGGDFNHIEEEAYSSWVLAEASWTRTGTVKPPLTIPSNNVGRDHIYFKPSELAYSLICRQTVIVDDLVASDHQPVWAEIKHSVPNNRLDIEYL